MGFSARASAVCCTLLAVAAGSGAAAAAEAALRVVPGLAWEKEGKASPDGRFYACKYGSHQLRILDGRHGRLAWMLRLRYVRDSAFSPDGRFLAACGDSRTLLMELGRGVPEYLDVPGGWRITFSPDSRHIYLVRRVTVTVTTPAAEGIGLFGQPRKRVRTIRKMNLVKISSSLETVATYSLDMSGPDILEFSGDGSTMTVTGVDGNAPMHVVYSRTAVQKIDLKTGEGSTEYGRRVRGYPRDRRRQALDELPRCDRKRNPGQGLVSTWWNAPSGMLVLHGYGMNGRTTKVWDVPRGRYDWTLCDTNEVKEFGGFLRPGVLVANGWQWVERPRANPKKTLTTVDIAGREVTETGIEGIRFSACPSGRYAAVFRDLVRVHAPLEVHDLETEKLVGSWPAVHVDSQLWWGSEGSYLAWTDRDQIELMVTSTGEKQTVKLQDIAPEVEDANVWSIEFERDSGLTALGVGNAKSGRAIVVDLLRRDVRATLKGFDGWVQGLCFTGNGMLLVGSVHGVVRLWDYRRDEVIWTADTGRHNRVVQFDYVPGGGHVVCQHLFRSATILDVRDGKVVRRAPTRCGARRSVKRPWTDPQLVGDGSVCLEMDWDTFQVHLARTETGERLLTYCALPEDQWMICTPGGVWDGSERVLQWVSFYRGLDPLDEREAMKLKDRKTINEVLRDAFGE